MAQQSIRVGSPAVCSPASCFTAIKYHQGRAKEGKKEQGREGGGAEVARQTGRRAGLLKKEKEREETGGTTEDEMTRTEDEEGMCDPANWEVEKEVALNMCCIQSPISCS